jgi:hypothetical protein
MQFMIIGFYWLFPLVYHILNSIGYAIGFWYVPVEQEKRYSSWPFVFGLNAFSYFLFISLYVLSFLVPSLGALFPSATSVLAMLRGTVWVMLFSFVPHLFLARVRLALSMGDIARIIALSNLIAYATTLLIFSRLV